LVKISEFQALIAAKEKLKNFSIRSYPEYSENEIKNELRSNSISYLNILEEKKRSNDFLSIKQKIESFKDKKILLKQKANIYLYEQSDSNNCFIGFICGVSTKDYINGHIKKHENTLKKREILFEKYLEDCKVHAEPVLLTYNKDNNVENFIINKIKEKTDYEFTTNDEKKHRIWIINETKTIELIKQYFSKIKNLYIADGHHRIASSNSYNENNQLNNPCLAFIISSNQLKLESFHRIISNPSNIEKKNLLNYIKKNKLIKETKQIIPVNKNEIKIYINNKWHSINLKNTESKNDLAPLIYLSEKILKPILNINNLQTTNKITYVADSDFKIKEIDKKNNLVFLLPKIEVKTIIDTANKNHTLPPKSTFILPKLRTGLLIMELK
jgi:uncharacterized protein (DUF1015 family)